MEFPFNINYTYYDNKKVYLNNSHSLYFIKRALAEYLQLSKLVRYSTKLYQLIDMIGLEKAYNLIISCSKYSTSSLSGVNLITMIHKDNISYHTWTSNNIETFKIMYNWSKQYEHVINEEKIDNSSIEQKLLDTTLQKIEIFADIIQSYENKFDRQAAEITALKEHLTKQDTEITALKTKLDTIIQLLTTH